MSTEIKPIPLPNPALTPFNARDFPNNFQRPRSRIVVVENVYHQSPGSDPIGIDTSSSRFCESDEQPWVRKTRVGEVWTALDTGFVTAPHLVVVRNDATVFQVNPTESERSEAERRIVVIGITGPDGGVDPFTMIRPGDSIRVYPVAGAKYSLRSQSGYAQITIHAFAG